MKRRQFLNQSAGLALGTLGASGLPMEAKDTAPSPRSTRRRIGDPRPLAITMWEFSWLERRWPGAGYEDWDLALSELADRGYDAVRIDAFPHLIRHDPEKEYLLLPHWSVQDWGSPSETSSKLPF